MRNNSILLMIAAIALPACAKEARDSVETPAASGLLIRGAMVLDMADPSNDAARDVLIVGDKIAMVSDPGVINPAKAERVIDGEWLYLMPGLIDVHAHIGDGGIEPNTPEDRDGAMVQFVRYGVTTIFAPGGTGGNDDDLDLWKKRCDAREILCPRIFGSGDLITARGSHPLSTIMALLDAVDAATAHQRGVVVLDDGEAAAALIAAKKAGDVDAVKIVIEDGPPPWYPKPRLSLEQVKDLAAASHEAGLKVYAHISGAAQLADAVTGGVDGVMHSAQDEIPDGVIKEMAQRKMFYVPTLALLDELFAPPEQILNRDPYALSGVSQKAIASLAAPAYVNQPSVPAEIAQKVWRTVNGNLKRAEAAGVLIALGTDVNNPGVFPGYSAHQELALMVRAGLTPDEALRTATLGGADFLDRETELGAITQGYAADLIALWKNPREDILGTRNIAFVVSRGAVFVDGAEIDQLIAQVSDASP